MVIWCFCIHNIRLKNWKLKNGLRWWITWKIPAPIPNSWHLTCSACIIITIIIIIIIEYHYIWMLLLFDIQCLHVVQNYQNPSSKWKLGKCKVTRFCLLGLLLSTLLSTFLLVIEHIIEDISACYWIYYWVYFFLLLSTLWAYFCLLLSKWTISKTTFTFDFHCSGKHAVGKRKNKQL